MSGLPSNPEFIKLERKGPVLYVWLNKPETRNALVGGMGEEIAADLHSVADDARRARRRPARRRRHVLRAATSRISTPPRSRSRPASTTR